MNTRTFSIIFAALWTTMLVASGNLGISTVGDVCCLISSVAALVVGYQVADYIVRAADTYEDDLTNP